MADTKDQRPSSKTDQAASDSAQHETLAFVPLTDDQTAQIKNDLGLDIQFLLVERLGRAGAREFDPGVVSLTRLTWCW
jgi:hypothetical protein